MKVFNNIIHLATLIVAIASIAQIDFPFRKPLLYVSFAYVLVVDVLIPLIKKS